MPKIRARKRLKNPNKLICFWLVNLVRDARSKSLKVAHTYEKALNSLKKYPLRITSAKECRILAGFGPTLCDLMESKLRALSNAKSLSVTEALSYGNSLSDDGLVALHSSLNVNSIPSKLFGSSDFRPVNDAEVQKEALAVDSEAVANKCNVVLDERICRNTSKISGDGFEIILLIDTRETFGMNKLKESLQQSLSGVSIHCEIRSLPVGDFIWVARLLDRKQSLSSNESEEIVLGIIVERKRADDLASSIVDGRFLEQKSRMQRLGFRCLYLFEEFHGMKNLRISYETLLQSLINSQLIDGCEVINVPNNAQCQTYLAAISRELCFKSRSGLSVFHGGLRPQNTKQSGLWGIPWCEFASIGSKSPPLPLRDEFGRHLLQIHGMTGPKAEGLLNAYPTPLSLFRAFDNLTTLNSKKELLMRQCPSDKLRLINRNLSEFIYYQYNIR